MLTPRKVTSCSQGASTPNKGSHFNMLYEKDSRNDVNKFVCSTKIEEGRVNFEPGHSEGLKVLTWITVESHTKHQN